ncbi:MAG: hypothetical protein JXJ17_08475 [Anaerolineae bacterium]|nr:hypothetical protein [Anaerolineae bacterium]
MKLKSRIVLVLGIIVLCGCAISSMIAEATPTQVSDTPTAVPSSTDTPQPTPTATSTLFQTRTPEPSATPTQTGTPAPTATPYNVPDDVPIVYPIGAAPEGAISRIGIGYILDMELSPDEQWIATGTSTGMYMLDASTYEELWSVATEHLVCEVNWSPDGSMIGYLLGCSEDNISGRVTDWRTGAIIREFANAQDLEWSPGTSLLAVIDSTGVVVWDTRTWEIYRMLEKEADFRYGWWSPDGRILAISAFGEVWVIDTTSFEVIYTLEHPLGYQLIVFSPDSKYMARYARNTMSEIFSSVNVYELSSGKHLYSYSHTVGEEWGFVFKVEFSLDGTIMAVNGNTLSTLVDAATGNILHYQMSVWSGMSAISPNGEYLILNITSYDTNPYQEYMGLWNVQTGEIDARLPLDGKVHDWFEDGQRFFLTYDYKLMKWDLSEREPLSVLAAVSAPCVSYYHCDTDKTIFWSPDSRFVATRSYPGDVLNVWDASSGNLINTAADEATVSGWVESQIHEIDSVDETIRIHIVEGEGNARWIEIENLLTGELFTVSETWKSRYSLIPFGFVYSPDGKRIALIYREFHTASVPPDNDAQANIIKVWDIETGEQLYRFVGHTEEAYSVAFSPDGTRLASVSADGSIVIWDVGP